MKILIIIIIVVGFNYEEIVLPLLSNKIQWFWSKKNTLKRFFEYSYPSNDNAKGWNWELKLFYKF